MPSPRTPHRHSGFTLVELLVVIALSVILISAATGLLYSSFIGSAKKDAVSTIKDEGDFAINQMAFLLRNAVALSSCTTNMTEMTFTSRDGGVTTFRVDAGRVASISAVAGATPAYLTSPAVTIPAPGLVFECSSTAAQGGTYIKLSFPLQKTASNANSSSSQLNEQFVTGVSVRSL